MVETALKKLFEIKSEMNFKDNFTFLSWFLDFISSTVIEDN